MPALNKYDFLYEKKYVCCLEEWPSPVHQKIYATFILVILFLLPLMLMLLLYSKIGYELWIKKRVGDSSVLKGIHASEMSKISRKKKRAIVMMVTVVVLFAVCWTPFHVIHMLIEYSNFEREYDDVTIKMIFGIVQVIGFANSICNPIVYAFMNENFKKNFLSAICFCVMKENLSPFRQHKNLKATMMQHEEGACRRELVSLEETRREAFSEGNIENVALYADVNGKQFPVSRGQDVGRYQVSWSMEHKLARSGTYEVTFFDEESYSVLRKAQRNNEDVLEIKPLFTVSVDHRGAWSGPWVSTEVLAALIGILVYYMAFTAKSNIQT